MAKWGLSDLECQGKSLQSTLYNDIFLLQHSRTVLSLTPSLPALLTIFGITALTWE